MRISDWSSDVCSSDLCAARAACRSRSEAPHNRGSMQMKTAVADMFGVESPILAFSHCRDVVAAVTNAGGFGVLGPGAHPPKQPDIDLTWTDEHVGGKPYGLDLLLPPNNEGTAEA